MTEEIERPGGRYFWRSLPLQEWPEADRQAWEKALHSGGPLDEGGTASRLRPRTRQTMAALYGQILAWLDSLGALDRNSGPGTCLTVPLARLYIKTRLETVSANTVFNNLRMIAMMLTCLAPDHDWSWIARDPYAPRRRHALAARKQRAIPNPARLRNRALNRFWSISRCPLTDETAIEARNALMLVIASQTCLRLRNLQDLRIGRNLLRRANGWQVVLDGSEVKNSRSIVADISGNLAAALNHYVDVLRPRLLVRCTGENDALWISRRGTILCDHQIWKIFHELGKILSCPGLHPHLARSMGTTYLATEFSQGSELASAALADNQETVSRHYDHSPMSLAMAKWQEQLEEIVNDPTKDKSK